MSLITINPDNPNYLDCNLDAVVLNPNGAIKYYNHYHTALYEDEKFDYFIPYQVKVINKYAGIHRGPARRYPTLAMIVAKDVYTITEERNGWGRLKEYPAGWIMLNATEPMTGPGQNPDYDVADQEVATIPFGEEIHITKLTIDRLWCWVPAVESWVKAEDVSYNQSGKLYNALDLKVIDLSKVNFSTLGETPTLADVGIYPEARQLRFHDASGYTYNGEYTKDAFSAIHELNFVYPETIYNYNCIYYRDNKADDNELGRSAFSCSISDWNPDWDTFIATSYLPKTKVYGYHAKFYGTNGSSEYANSYTVYSEPSTSSSSKTIKYWGGKEHRIYGPKTTVGGVNWWPLLTLDGKEWAGYTTLAPTIEYKEIDTEPTLYRDTVLTLNWDYFGFKRNLYKPAGSGDGIYLWNPRSWDIDNVMFSFEELVRCGSQYVIYPDFDPTLYKITVCGNYLGAFSSKYYLMAPPISLALIDNNMNEATADIGISIEKGPYIRCPYSGAPSDKAINAGSSSQEQEYIQLGKGSFWLSEDYTPPEIISQDIENYKDVFNHRKENDYLIEMNISYLRNIARLVFREGKNNITQEPGQYYFIKNEPTHSSDGRTQIHYNAYPLNYNTNLKDNLDFVDYTNNNNYSSIGDYGTWNYCYSYNNSLMAHYWIPVPKGLRYRRNGQNLRIPNNGFYDLITGNFKGPHTIADGPLDLWYSSLSASWTKVQPTIDGRADIWLRNEKVDMYKDSYNYFNGWNFVSTDRDYIIKTKGKTPSFKYPDNYATPVRSLASGLVIPVSKSTSDSANNVEGEWYFSGDQWFESNKGEIYAGSFDKTKLTKLRQQIYLLNTPTKTLTFYTHLDPSTLTTSTDKSSYSYGQAPAVLTTYYSYTNDVGTFYFDGAYWVPQDYTDKNITEHNKNYAIARATDYYSGPIADDEYKVGTYHYGDRITVPYVATNNPDWGYTGIGWIQLANNTSEVV